MAYPTLLQLPPPEDSVAKAIGNQAGHQLSVVAGVAEKLP